MQKILVLGVTICFVCFIFCGIITPIQIENIIENINPKIRVLPALFINP
jgi:hypothetical protein